MKISIKFKEWHFSYCEEIYSYHVLYVNVNIHFFFQLKTDCVLIMDSVWRTKNI